MKLLHRIILLTLTLLVLVSSTGFSVEVHACAGEVRDLSFYGQATECAMDQKGETLPPCHAPQKERTPLGNCCEEHQLVLEALDVAFDSHVLVISKSLDFKFIAAVKAVVLQLIAPKEELDRSDALYTSPPIARDIPVLVQSFLI